MKRFKSLPKRDYPPPYPIHSPAPKLMPTDEEESEVSTYYRQLAIGLTIILTTVIVILLLYIKFNPKERVVFLPEHPSFSDGLEALEPNALVIRTERIK